ANLQAPSVLSALFAAAGRRHARALAIVDDTGQATYGELERMATGIARGLVARGLQVGDRVGIQLPNGIPWLAAYWAATFAGCVVVPLNPRNRPAEIAYMLSRSGAAVLLTGDDAPVEGV